MAWTPLLPAHPRKAEAVVCIILGRGADLEEQRTNSKKMGGGAGMPPHPAPIGRPWKHGFPCSQKACPSPPPHPPHEVLANRPGGHKVAASPQGSQPGGVTPSRRRPELGHPACRHSFCGGPCPVSTSFLSTSTHLLCPWAPVGSRGTFCPLGDGKARHQKDAEKGREPGDQAKKVVH